MAKLKLDLSDLKVESFETAIRSVGEEGTVVGQTVYETGCNTYCNYGCGGLTQGYNSCFCPDDSAPGYASCGTTCGPDGPECQTATSYSLYETVCVTGCESCE